MRIIAGERRGAQLYAPKGMDTRPTQAMVREALFNILQFDLQGAQVLDLFGGSGALALEALSRGAERATIVDASAKAISCIRRNAQAVLGEGVERAQIIRADYRRAMERMRDGFDLVFLDPPYRMEAAYADALVGLRDRGLLLPGATIVLERAAARVVSLPGGFSSLDTRRYGETCVEFIGEGEQT